MPIKLHSLLLPTLQNLRFMIVQSNDEEKTSCFPNLQKKTKAIKRQFYQIPPEHYLLEMFIFVELVCNYLLFKDNYHTLLNTNKVFSIGNINNLAAFVYSMNLKLCLEMKFKTRKNVLNILFMVKIINNV